MTTRQYLNILYLAAYESEAGVDDALRVMIDQNMEITDKQVKKLVLSKNPIPHATDIHVLPVNLRCYDQLLQEVIQC